MTFATAIETNDKALGRVDLPTWLEPAEHYEVVAGQIVGEPPMGALESWIAARLTRAINSSDPGGTAGAVYEEMLFILAKSPRLRRRPDLAFVSAERWPVDEPAPAEAAWDIIPDLAIEIVSPTDPADDLMLKIEEYFTAGVRLVWVIHSGVRKLYAYESPKSVVILDAEDRLGGGDVLAGFEMPLGRIFVADRPDTGSTPA